MCVFVGWNVVVVCVCLLAEMLEYDTSNKEKSSISIKPFFVKKGLY